MLVPDAILVEELTWVAADSKCRLEVRSVVDIDDGELDRAIVLVSKHSHDVGDKCTMPFFSFATRQYESHEPGFVDCLAAVKDLCILVGTQVDHVVFGQSGLIIFTWLCEESLLIT